MLRYLLAVSLFGSSLQAGFLPGSFSPISVDASTHYVKPAFCHDLECPKYAVLETNAKFEKRQYEATMWVATELTAMVFTDQDNRNMFFDLFHYISGNNSQHMKIAMTAPVLDEVVHGAGPDCESNFTMHFMVPFELQANPPQPTQKGVFIRQVPKMTVYVRSYPGYPTDDAKRQNIEQLVNDLQAANRSYKDAVFYTAGYDGPYAVNRHNEIWLIAV